MIFDPKGVPIYNPSEEEYPQVQYWKQWSAGKLLIVSVVNRFRSHDRIKQRLDDAQKAKDKATSEKLKP